MTSEQESKRRAHTNIERSSTRELRNRKKKSTVKRVVRVNTDNICRVCGKLSDSLLSMYSDSAKRRHVPAYIDRYLPIKVSETDAGWPKNICELCIKCLIEWNGLYSKCKQVNMMFGKLLNRPPFKAPTKATQNNSVSSHHEITRDELDSVLRPPNSHNDHNYCPKNDAEIISEEASPGNRVDDSCIQSDVAADRTSKCSVVKDKCLTDKPASEEINEGSENLLLLSSCMDNNKENLESSQLANANQLSGNGILSEGCKTNSAKQEYKIGITLVKNKDCNEGTELDFSSLKSILISKVNQLFQSICSDKTIGKSLVNRNRRGSTNDCSNADNISATGDEDRMIDTCETVLMDVDKVDVPEPIKTGIKSRHRKKTSQHSPLLRRRRTVIPDETGSYLCSDCGSMITERKSFLNHRRMYHIEKKCHYCNETLPSLHEYRRHLRISHLDKISNSCCEICGATFIRRERLQRHKLIIHNIGEYVYCNICNKKCASRQQLYCHKSDAHNKVKNLCHHCGQNFASHQSFLAHLKKKHSYRKNLSCINCDKTFSTRANLETHIEKCQNESNLGDEPSMKVSPKILSANSKLYTCLICSVKITDVEMLKQHMNYHANDDCVKNLVSHETKGDYDCVLCGMYLNTERDLALHRFYSHQEAPFICRVSECNISFWKRMSLIMHQMTVHKMPNNTCKICSKSFLDFKEKRHHMKSHHSARGPQDKPYACTICNRQFCWKSTLKTHMVIHSDVKMYKCNLCGKEFKLKLTLSKHMQYHQRKQMEEEASACEVQEVTQVAEVTEVATVTDISGVAEHIDMETESKQLFTMSSDDQGLTVVNTTGLLKICTVFKCPACNILFTHKETRDSHYLEEHTDKQTVNYEIADVINVNLHESEFV